MFPLNGAILLPGCDLPLNVFEPRYLNMFDDALKGDRLIAMIQNIDQHLAPVGSLGRITQFSETDDGRYLIVLRGLKRFNFIGEVETQTPYRIAKLDFTKFADDIDAHMDANLPESLSDKGGSERAALTVAMKAFAKHLRVDVDWDALADIPLNRLIDQATMISPLNPQDKQSLLEAHTHDERRRLLTGLMTLYSASDNLDNPLQ
ncbi:MAG: LON peptidase substrate-binding domain-containing protein [Maricaulaceae bacterium]